MTEGKWTGAPNSSVLLQVLVMGYILKRLPIEPHYVKLKISFSQNVDMIGHNLFMNKQEHATWSGDPLVLYFID